MCQYDFRKFANFFQKSIAFLQFSVIMVSKGGGVMTIGERIKARRIELKLSADKIGEKIGKDRATVYRYEGNDIENMPVGVLKPLAEALKTTPAYLMGWEDSDDTAPKKTLSILSATQEKILSNCQQLNEKGQEKVLDFSDDLIGSGKYTELGREPVSRIAAHGASETEEDIQPPTEEITT